MEAAPKSAAGWVQRRLPFLVVAAALLLYGLTLNRWARLETLQNLARVTGRDWLPSIIAPLGSVFESGLKLLPAAWQPVSFNLLSAVFAALALGLLARTVSLLPFDRTREERMRERSPGSILTCPWAWVPPVLAVVLCGLELSFWEHSTAATGEALDLLIFAYVLRCLAEYRFDQRRSWLWRLAFVYGLGVANNYAMIAFFPVFFLGLVWIQGPRFFQWRFLLQLLGFGLAGLSAYLILPLIGVIKGLEGVGFWPYLKTEFYYQKTFLLAFPRYVLIVLAFTSVFPLIVRGIRWPGGAGESAGGSNLTGLMTQSLNAVLFAACVSVAFDPKWSARAVGLGLALLPFYYLAALSAAYFAGYFILMGRQLDRRVWVRETPGQKLVSSAGTFCVVGLTAVAAGVLVSRNFPQIKREDGQTLWRFAENLISGLPVGGKGYVFGDDAIEVELATAALRLRGDPDGYIPVNTRLMETRYYHQQMARLYANRWLKVTRIEQRPEPLDAVILTSWLRETALSNAVYYLRPSFGYYFEVAEARPRGIMQQLQLVSQDGPALTKLTPEELKLNRAFWAKVEGDLRTVEPGGRQSNPETRWMGVAYSRALNAWAVNLQRAGQWDEAAKLLAVAHEINPSNLIAQVNLDFNQRWRRGAAKGIDPQVVVNPKGETRSWDELVSTCGPADDPQWCFTIGRLDARNGVYHQARAQFERVLELAPDHPEVALWQQNMITLEHLGVGDVAGAEKLALKLRQEHPKDENVLDTLVQVYLMSGRLTNALETVDALLATDPINPRALLNKAAICIQLGRFEQAIPPLDKVLIAQPDSTAALMNRAIANLQTGQLPAAQKDYESLRRLLPKYHAVYYGLAEICYRRKDMSGALANYEQYLKYGVPGTEEYNQVAQRVTQLKASTAAR